MGFCGNLTIKQKCVILVSSGISIQVGLVCATALLEFSFGESVDLSKKLYVGNLSFQATEDQVRSLFETYGNVESVAMINDRETGRFRGFCFVEMENAEATAAIAGLDGKEVDGRNLRVNEAQPREERSGGGPRNSGGPRSGGGGGFNRNRDGGNRRESSDRRNDYGSGGGRRW